MERGNRDLRHGTFYSKSETVIIYRVTPPTHTGSRTRGCSLGQRPLITFHVPTTVPLMSAIKAGHVRDTSVIRVLALPPPPAAAVCASLTSVPGPGMPLVPGHVAPGPAVPHYVRGPDVRPSRPVFRRPFSRRDDRVKLEYSWLTSRLTERPSSRMVRKQRAMGRARWPPPQSLSSALIPC